MKCQSIACLWSTSPPQHNVTAATVLSDPPTLYTGGSDGSIVWWHFETTQKQEAWPMALLCGHAAPIADLTTCRPVVGDDENEEEASGSGRRWALFSACGDGVLCVWSRGSGHCKRRRKLPPWAGKPCVLGSVPEKERYICVSCVCADSSGSHGVEEGEGGGVEREGNCRKGSKVAVLVVDSCSLSIVRTVFHGVSTLGKLRCVDVVRGFEGVEKKQVVALVDAVGKVQLVAMEPEQEGSGGSAMCRSSSSSTMSSVYEEILNDGADAISVSVKGRILVLVFETHCIFKSVLTGKVVGEISLEDVPFCSEEQCSPLQFVGSMFLQNDKLSHRLDDQDPAEGTMETLVIWNSMGDAISYAMRATIKNSDIELYIEPLSKIPGSLDRSSVKRFIHFSRLDNSIVRVESIGYVAGGSLVWRPHITIWSVPEIPMPYLHCDKESGRELYASACGNPGSLCVNELLGEGSFAVGWLEHGSSNPDQDRLMRCSNKEELKKVQSSASGSADLIIGECISHFENEQAVSSSMVLSEDFYSPYAVVYGFYSGYIEIICFRESFAELNSIGGNVSKYTKRLVSKQSFIGHTGAVLCLAAHHMVDTSIEHGFHQVLVSGSLDSTVRLWNLDNGALVFVLHHHVGPVKQIILPPPCTDPPWSNCFLSVGEDCCVALVSLETLRVERMFPGHPCYPSMVVWDSSRGYIACLCRNLSSPSNAFTSLYLWDVKTGARERVFRGIVSYLVFDYFCRGISINAVTGNILGGSTSASLLHLPVIEDASVSNSHVPVLQKGNGTTTATFGRSQRRSTNVVDSSGSLTQGSKAIAQVPSIMQNPSYDAARSSSAKQVLMQPGSHKGKHSIKCSCPFAGVAAFKFDLASLVSRHQTHMQAGPLSDKVDTLKSDHEVNELDLHRKFSKDTSIVHEAGNIQKKESAEEYLIRFSLALLHLWDANLELDKLLKDEMNILRPEGLIVASGVPGDRGSMMLMFPGLRPALQLWKSSSEFCAMRSLTIVSLAQRLFTLSHSGSVASSALAAFYTRTFAEEVPDVKPPSLELLVSFWQDPSEYVRMAARSLFHCAAPRAIPCPISSKRTQFASSSIPINLTEEDSYCNKISTSGDSSPDSDGNDQVEEAGIVTWLESFDMHDWISCIGGTMQDAMASHVIVAAALTVWYPSIVKSKLAIQVVNHLLKLVMSINDRYSSTAVELLAEGMDSTWKAFIGPEIPRLIGDIFFQIECLSGLSSSKSKQNPALTINIRESLIWILLPSLAMIDIRGFLSVIEGQIWATSSDSPVHLVSVTILIRVIRGSPKPLAPYLDRVINFILQTLDHANSVMRKICLQSSMVALREVAHVFPMVALNEATSRLAVGDAIGDIHSITIRVYDLQSMAKIKVLDASGPPGLPSLLSGTSDATVSTAISAVSFSPDGEGLVAFSEHGLVLRWWSLGTAWWEKLSRSMVPVQCTKLIFVPPWEGISPNSSRKSIIASMVGHGNGSKSPEKARESNDTDKLRILIHKLDLSYRLDWIDGRKVVLTGHRNELGSFQF